MLWGIFDDFIRGDIRPQVRLPWRNQDRIIVSDAIDGTRPQTGYQSNQSIFTPDPSRPTKLVIAECNPRTRGQKILANRLSHNFLDHDAHLLMDIQESAFCTVFRWVGTEDRRVHLRHCIHQSSQPFFSRSAIPEEETFVLAAKCRSWPIFEQAGAPNDERHIPKVVESQRQSFGKFRWKR